MKLNELIKTVDYLTKIQIVKVKGAGLCGEVYYTGYRNFYIPLNATVKNLRVDYKTNTLVISVVEEA